MDHLTRRTVLGSLAAVVAGPSSAQDSPLAHGVLRDNRLAKQFISAPDGVPSVKIVGPTGKLSLGELVKDRTVIMPLWAEWCAPCRTELPALARLQRKYGSASFAIMPVLTCTRTTPTSLGAIMASFMKLGAFEPLIEEWLGSELVSSMAVRRHSSVLGGGRVDGTGAAMPCTLVVAPGGGVRARLIGTLPPPEPVVWRGGKDYVPGDSTYKILESYDDLFSPPTSEAIETLWASADGDELAGALARGFLRDA